MSDSSQTTCLTGVLSYTKWKLLPSSNHTITHLIGEDHVDVITQKNCDTVDEMFRKLILKKQPVSLLIELSYMNKQQKVSSKYRPRLASIVPGFERSNITTLKQQYLDCIYNTNQQCSLPSNVQVQACDMRQEKSETHTYSLDYLEFAKPVHDVLDWCENPFSSKMSSKILQKLLLIVTNPCQIVKRLVQEEPSSKIGKLYKKLCRQGLTLPIDMILDCLMKYHHDRKAFDNNSLTYQEMNATLSKVVITWLKQGKLLMKPRELEEYLVAFLCSYGSLTMDLCLLFHSYLNTVNKTQSVIVVGNTHAEALQKVYTMLAAVPVA